MAPSGQFYDRDIFLSQFLYFHIWFLKSQETHKSYSIRKNRLALGVCHEPDTHSSCSHGLFMLVGGMSTTNSLIQQKSRGVLGAGVGEGSPRESYRYRQLWGPGKGVAGRGNSPDEGQTEGCGHTGVECGFQGLRERADARGWAVGWAGGCRGGWWPPPGLPVLFLPVASVP